MKSSPASTPASPSSGGGRGHGQDLAEAGPLHRGVYEALVPEVDLVHLALDVVVDHDAGDGQHLLHAGEIADLGEVGQHREAGAAEEVAPLAPDGERRDALHVWLALQRERGAGAVHVRVQPARQAAISGDVNEGEVPHLALSQQRVQRLHVGATGAARELREHRPHPLRVGARGERSLLRPPHLGGSHELHRLGDLRGVRHGANAIAHRSNRAGSGHLRPHPLPRPRGARSWFDRAFPEPIEGLTMSGNFRTSPRASSTSSRAS